MLPTEMLLQAPESLTDFQCAFLLRNWTLWARAEQIPPDFEWRTWLILAGRGFGKTRTGAEWVRAQVKKGAGHIGLIAPTSADARDIMVEGESGILSVCSAFDLANDGAVLGVPKFQSSRRKLTWQNGATAMLFSAEEPERLRGPQHERIWADELAAWRNAQETWDMAMFGLRLGDDPRACVTTTPKPIGLLKALMGDEATHVVRGSTFENSGNLATAFLENVRRKYGGTELGRQELDGEFMEARENALWGRGKIELNRVAKAPELRRIIVAIDPPATSHKTSDACGIIVAGCDDRGHAYILSDKTISAAKPSVWAARAVGEFHRWEADNIIAEVNQGGEMVESVLRAIDADIPLKAVRATRSKFLRAEPVAALYEADRVHHVGSHAALEDEMCDFTVHGLSSNRSPDRLDACVWAIHELLLGRQSQPRIRSGW